jgi:hypothetical protein
MNKPVVIAAAALLAAASFSPSGAQARDRGGALAAGVIGGLAVGALAGAAIANSHRAPVHVYDDDSYVPAYRPKVRVYNYYEAPSYSGYGYYSGYDYSSGYHDGYRDGYYDADW